MTDQKREINLTDCFDAKVWAKEFMRIYKEHSDEWADWIDEDLMISWFATAIMAGYDHAYRKIKKEIEAIL